jgi:hypothetical protein
MTWQALVGRLRQIPAHGNPAPSPTDQGTDEARLVRRVSARQRAVPDGELNCSGAVEPVPCAEASAPRTTASRVLAGGDRADYGQHVARPAGLRGPAPFDERLSHSLVTAAEPYRLGGAGDHLNVSASATPTARRGRLAPHRTAGAWSQGRRSDGGDAVDVTGWRIGSGIHSVRRAVAGRRGHPHTIVRASVAAVPRAQQASISAIRKRRQSRPARRQLSIPRREPGQASTRRVKAVPGHLVRAADGAAARHAVRAAVAGVRKRATFSSTGSSATGP